MPQLTVRRGLYRKTYSFTDPDIVTVGKHPNNTIVLPDDRVSRFHAAIVTAASPNTVHFIRDLASLHGVVKGGRYVSQERLQDGDAICILDFELTFFDGIRINPGTNLFSVVRRKADYPATGDSTVPFARGPGTEGDFGDTQSEIQAALRKLTTTADARLVFAAIMAPLLRVLAAHRGFAAFFTDIVHEYQYFGVTGMEPGQTIEISAADFLDRVRGNQMVHDGTTLVAPIVTGQSTVGFICVDRLAPAPEFSDDDAMFLRQISAVPELHLQCPADEKTPPERALRWGVERIEKSGRLDGIHQQITLAARANKNVLILGESGTGKEGIARTIHEKAQRRGALFALNCADLNEHLAQMQLFGYKAKSGIENADPQGAPGMFEANHGGTVFLDEIQTLSIPNQEKLLRVLEQKQVVRIGEHRERPVDVLVLAATSQDLTRSREEGKFLDALYFRFGTTISLPPLRERTEDIPLLVHCFLDNWASERTLEPRETSHAAMKFLLRQKWAGNIRELKNAVDRALETNRNILFSWDFGFKAGESPAQPGPSAGASPVQSASGEEVSTDARLRSMDEVEEDQLREALQVTKGNITQTARSLNWAQQTVRNKMKKYDIPLGYGRP